MLALLLIDIQKGLDEAEHWGDIRNNPEAEANCRRILDFFRYRDLPLYHIQHCSTNPDSPLFPGKDGNAIKDIVAPLSNETVIQKNTNSAFVGTDLENRLNSEGIAKLIVVGLTTDHCVSATVRTAADLGFKVTMISDATATYAKTGIDGIVYEPELIHKTAMASLKNEFATIMDTSELLHKLKSSDPFFFAAWS